MASDNFNRADGGLGGNWTVQIDAISVVSNEAGSASSNGSITAAAYYNGTFNANQSAQLKPGSDASTGSVSYSGPIVLATGSTTTTKFYWFRTDGTIQRYDRSSGAFELAFNSSAVPTSGTTMLLESTGSTLIGFLDGVEKIRASDTNYTSGNPGIAFLNTKNATIDDFQTTGDANAASSGVPVLRKIRRLVV